MNSVIKKRGILVLLVSLSALCYAGPPRTPTMTYVRRGVIFISKDFQSPMPWPKTGFFGASLGSISEPIWGYPFHNSMFIGLNDTHTVRVEIANYSTTPYVIKTVSPQTWLMPVLYQNCEDYMNGFNPIDTSQFDYAFRGWVYDGDWTSKPDTLKPGEAYVLEYDIWNLSHGMLGVDMAASSSKPSYFSAIKHHPSEYYYVAPTDIKDSINAYIRIVERLNDRQAFTSALAWTDSIFGLNDSSVAGWIARGFVKTASADTTGAIDAFDRVITIINNNHDPLINLADTTLSREEMAWANDRYNSAVYYKWKLVTKSRYYPR